MSTGVVQNVEYRNKQKRKDAFISTFIGIFAFVWIFPILWTVWTSLRPYNDIISYGIFSWPRRLTFDNYINAIKEMKIGVYLLNSLIVTVPSVILTLFFGSLVAAISGLLKAYRGVHEVITTIMLNSIVMAIADYLASGKLREPGQFLTRTSEIAESARLPIIGSLPSGFFIAVILGVFIWWVLGRTTSGFRIETVGRNRHAAWYSGISVKRTVVSAMLVSGAIAGLGGAIETLGVTYRYAPAFNLGLGFDGITIALLGRVHPIGIIPGAILIGGMRAGAANMQFDAGVAPEIVDLLMALILLFVTAPLITRFFKNSSNKSMTSGWGN